MPCMPAPAIEKLGDKENLVDGSKLFRVLDLRARRCSHKWGKTKTCPHCNSPFETKVKLKVFAIALIPALIIHLFILRPLVVALGLHGAISNGIICGILSVLSMRYRKVRSTNIT